MEIPLSLWLYAVGKILGKHICANIFAKYYKRIYSERIPLEEFKRHYLYWGSLACNFRGSLISLGSLIMLCLYRVVHITKDLSFLSRKKFLLLETRYRESINKQKRRIVIRLLQLLVIGKIGFAVKILWLIGQRVAESYSQINHYIST